ncbi:MAG: hypothetical protein KJ666_00915 [Bacteroidetes bacterium]|nr:hypothetical protein [Bacteroidota bacterium]MBU2585084.1 hypothetical protein [Bacteroidota bacterium]
MKKTIFKKEILEENELLPEYDFTGARPNKYAESIAKKRGIVRLEPDVKKIFPDSDSVNKALRAIISAYPKKVSKKVVG